MTLNLLTTPPFVYGKHKSGDEYVRVDLKYATIEGVGATREQAQWSLITKLRDLSEEAEFAATNLEDEIE